MVGVQKRKIRWVISLFLVMLYFSGLPAQAQYGGGSNTIDLAETSTYVFLSDQSTVVQTGGIAGVHETYPIQGQFQLTVDANDRVASFDYVDAFLLSPISSSPPQSLGELFNMTSLLGAVLDDTTISFTGKAADGSDVLITLTIEDDLAYLVGETIPPPNTADFFLFSLDAVAQRKYGGGSGEPNDPYQIATAEDLMLLGESPEDYDKHFILTADIDLDPNLPRRRVFNRAVVAPDVNDGGRGFQGTPFTGILDGNGHTISHLTIEGRSYLGLFGRLESPAEIKHLGVVDVNIAGWSNCGGLVGDTNDTISNCYSSGDVSGDTNVGGLVGKHSGTITNCYSVGSVTGTTNVGGLVGYNRSDFWGDGTISNCYSTGSVSGDEEVGGLVGSNSGTITNCYSTGSVSGNEDVGGLVGLNGSDFWGDGTISNCYSVGHVTGTTNVGGLVGINGGQVTGSFWDIQTSEQSTSDGGTGKTTSEMQIEITFTDAGWDFVGESVNGTDDIWSICEGTNYPRLVWQIPAGDFVCPDGITIDDFEFFTEHWLDDNCDISNDYCQGTDLDFSGTVDANDLEIFFENWLAVGELEN